MGEITTRTVGEGGEPLELTIEEQIALEGKAAEDETGAYSREEQERAYTEAQETEDAPEFVRATFFTPEPVIVLQGVFTAGEIELPLTVEEARETRDKLSEALGA